MREEEKIMAGILFCPGDPDLREIKRRTHNLNVDYNATYEDEVEKRAQIIREIVGEIGDGGFMQGPYLLSLWKTHQNWQKSICQLQLYGTGRCLCHHW